MTCEGVLFTLCGCFQNECPPRSPDDRHPSIRQWRWCWRLSSCRDQSTTFQREIFRPCSRTEDGVTTSLAPKGVRRHSQRFRSCLAVSHRHQKVKEIAQSASTPSDKKALTLDDPIQDICGPEPTLYMTSYRRSRIYEDERQTAPSTQEVDGAGVIGAAVGGDVGAPVHCGANHLAGKQHCHKITK